MREPAVQWEPLHLPRAAVRISRWSLRLFLGAAAMGAASAFAAALVRLGFRGLQWALTGSSAEPPVAAEHLGLWRRALTPLAGALLASVVPGVRRWRAERSGREPRPYVEYVEAVRHRGGLIPLLPNCWRTLSAAFSVASGAAVGREGSMIQFAAAVASRLGRSRGWLAGRDAVPLAFLVACGVAGGVTAAYNAPGAAVFFAAEIVLGSLHWRALPALGVAAGAGWVVSGFLLGRERLYPVHAQMGRPWMLLLLPMLALLCGALSPAYQRLIGSLRSARRLPLALLWGGAVVGVLSCVDPRVWGNGDMGLNAALGRTMQPGASTSAEALLVVLVLRLAATTVCVGTGTVGGVFTPTLFAGGALGALVGHAVIGTNGTLWAIAGMSCLMAAATHAPLMAAFMAVELTGDWKLLPGLLGLNLVAWQVAQRISPQAMFAIASQSPENGEPRRGDGSRRVP